SRDGRGDEPSPRGDLAVRGPDRPGIRLRGRLSFHGGRFAPGEPATAIGELGRFRPCPLGPRNPDARHDERLRDVLAPRDGERALPRGPEQGELLPNRDQVHAPGLAVDRGPHHLPKHDQPRLLRLDPGGVVQLVEAAQDLRDARPRTMPRPLTAVITTVQGPTPSVRALASRLGQVGATLLIVGDERGPGTYEQPGTELITLEDQHRLPFSLAPL